VAHVRSIGEKNGTYFNGGAGASSSGNGVQAVNTAVTTGEAVQAGDILTIGADNLAYHALDPTMPGATLRPISQATAILNGLQSPATLLSSSPAG